MITQNMLMNWVGNNDNSEKQIVWLSNTLLEIANGEFTQKQLIDDITQYDDQTSDTENESNILM